MEITQGSIITGVRSAQYQGESCCAVVITARCDLANCKIDKVYYLIALPIDDWFFSETGSSVLLHSYKLNLVNRIKEIIERYGLDWEVLQSFSEEEFCKVVRDTEINISKAEIEKSIKFYKEYQECKIENTTVEYRKALLKKVKKQIKGVLTEIVLGSNTRFTFVPQSAYGEKDKTKGLIIDNRDLNYFLVPTLEDVVSCQVDSQNIRLTEEKREYYNKIFCLSDGQGFALVDTEITSPWIEYVLQRFSNLFTRIGVDGPDKEQDIPQMFERIIGD